MVVVVELVILLLLYTQGLLFAFGIGNQSIDDPLPAYYTYAHVFTFVVLIWLGIYLLKCLLPEVFRLRKLSKYFRIDGLYIPYRLSLVLLGLLSLYYQSELFRFEYTKSGLEGDGLFVFLVIPVLVWFVGHQVKLLIRNPYKTLLVISFPFILLSCSVNKQPVEGAGVVCDARNHPIPDTEVVIWCWEDLGALRDEGLPKTTKYKC